MNFNSRNLFSGRMLVFSSCFLKTFQSKLIFLVLQRCGSLLILCFGHFIFDSAGAFMMAFIALLSLCTNADSFIGIEG